MSIYQTFPMVVQVSSPEAAALLVARLLVGDIIEDALLEHSCRPSSTPSLRPLEVAACRFAILHRRCLRELPPSIGT